ncbi:MAG: LysE family translocator [Alphaproteobacteria bacterium]|nr:LysE family translocator [Alphaproteobacteria bacterium]
MLAFAAAVFFLIITPGPGVLSVAGIGSGFGFRAGNRFVFGLWVGNNFVALLVVSGLAVAVMADPVVRTVLLGASTAYLLYLAARIALAGSKIAFIERQSPPGTTDAIALQFVNPKAYAVNTAFFSGFGFLPAEPSAEILIKFVIMNAIWIPIHYLWLWAGVTVRRLDLPPRTQSIINILMAAAMVAVVALALLAPHA